MTRTYSTSEVSQAARTTDRAIRLWERKGLFGEVARDHLNERRFTESQLQRARIVSAASMAGMTLVEIASAHHVTLLSAIGAAAGFMKRTYQSMDKDFDL